MRNFTKKNGNTAVSPKQTNIRMKNTDNIFGCKFNMIF